MATNRSLTLSNLGRPIVASMNDVQSIFGARNDPFQLQRALPYLGYHTRTQERTHVKVEWGSLTTEGRQEIRP
jgi:hypothetical protein